MTVNPQNVLENHNVNTIFLVWRFRKEISIKNAFKEICDLSLNLNHSSYIRFPDEHVSCVMGIGHDAWVRLDLPKPLPQELQNFEAIAGNPYVAVSTPGDLHFHLRGDNKSICFDMAEEISKILEPVADCLVEVHGFRYWDGRSILGFVDGTENPQRPNERKHFGLIGEEDPTYKGGSYLFVQKYIHDLRSFKALSLEEQENVFGRYKENDLEMPDDIKPTNSHIALADVGDDKKVIRDNLPFGDMATNEMGTYFIAYARHFSFVQEMLENMFIGDPPGNYDRLLDFSTAKTGSLFFVPSLDMLEDFAEGEAEEEEEMTDLKEENSESESKKKSDDSLQIGSLKPKN